MADLKSAKGNVYNILALLLLVLWLINFLFFPTRENIFIIPNVALPLLATLFSSLSSGKTKILLIIISVVILGFAAISSLYLYGSNLNRNV